MEQRLKTKTRPSRHKEELEDDFRRLPMGEMFSRVRRSNSEKELENELKEMKVDNKLLVAAIDIGTTYSGYAFSFRHDQEGESANLDLIRVNTWENEGGCRNNFKTPSCLLLHPNGNLDCFGNEAMTKYNTLLEDNNHKDYYFFWHFKMVLHQEKEIRAKHMLKDESGKELPALTVFRYSIQYLKEHLTKVVKDGTLNFRDSDIRWVITVPSIWKESAKKFMRQAAVEAGIAKHQIEIALEPESASLCCRSMRTCRADERGASEVSSLRKFPKGTRYMVLDCGGGTVDVTVHEVIDDNTLRELHAATGGDWGGTKVNNAFWNFISELVGPKNFQAFSKDHKADYLQLLNDFELKKRMTIPDSTDAVSLRVPISLYKILEQNEYNFARFDGAVNLVGDKLRFRASYFKGFFDAAVRDILNHVEKLVKEIPGPLTAVLLVGGFSESPVLQKAVKDQFGQRFHIVIPFDASLCVMKGAVLYGFNPISIASRCSRYTYGVETSMTYRPGDYPAERNHGGFVDQIFDKHVEVGQEIPANKALTERIYYPITNDDKILHISLYRSSKPNPKFVNEQGCQRVGTFEIKIDRSVGRNSRERPITVKMIFGSSDIKILAQQKNCKCKEADFKLNGDL